MAKSEQGPTKRSRPRLVLRTKKLSKSQQKKAQKSKRLPRAWRIMGLSLLVFKNNFKVIAGITLVYGILSVLFVQSSANIANIGLEEPTSGFERATNDFSSLVSSFGASDSFMQIALLLIIFLALVWALRRLYAGEPASTKSAYYLGMTPIIPVILLSALLFIQLLPMLIASAGLQFASGSGVGGTALEVLVWLVVFILATVWSFSMIPRTLTSIFIVTLPGMTPGTARKKAKELVVGRRISISLKLIFLPVFIIFCLAVILIPIIMVLPGLASPLFIVISPIATSLSIIYLFNLYQEIIK